MSRSIVSQLRDIVPLRPLTRQEALSIAERQALRFLHLVGITEPAVPERVMAEMPRIHVERLSPFPASGATHWVSGRWVVVLNGSEPRTRQRFSLAHELKHIIDHPFVDRLYLGIDPRDRQAWIEQICDFFAGSLLVPRPWLKRAWTNGEQHVPTLAARFGVSQAAMNTRLAQTGLIDPASRCARPSKDWIVRAIREAGSSALYHRSSAALSLKKAVSSPATSTI